MRAGAAFAVVALLCFAAPASASELAPSGTLRAVFLAGNPVQARIDPATGAIAGPAADIARALAEKEGLKLDLKGLPGTRAVIDAVKADQADIGFLAHDPERAAEVDFTQAYSLAHNTYLVLASAPIRTLAEIDRSGVKIGVGQGDAADLYLKRTLAQATLVPNPGGSLDTALAQLRSGTIDAYAANRQRLTGFAATRPELRLLDANFLAVRQAIIVPKEKGTRLALLDKFLDEARASGLLAQAIARAALAGVDVAPKP
jgi:polar amino acid transport system substrate-binding protein